MLRRSASRILILCCGLAACAPSAPQTPVATVLNAPITEASANPLQKEGQLILEIQAAEVKGLEQAPTDTRGLLKADGAGFRIARENGPELVSGKVSANMIRLPAEKLGKGPYLLTLTLVSGEVLEVRLQDTISAGDRRVIRAEMVKVVNQTCGNNCVQIGDDVNTNQTNTRIEGPNCPGVGNTCSAPARD